LPGRVHLLPGCTIEHAHRGAVRSTRHALVAELLLSLEQHRLTLAGHLTPSRDHLLEHHLAFRRLPELILGDLVPEIHFVVFAERGGDVLQRTVTSVSGVHLHAGPRDVELFAVGQL